MLGENRNANNILAGKTDGRRRLLRRCTHKWQDNIKVTLKDIRCECLDLIHVAQHKHHWWAFVNAVMDVKFQKQTWKFFNS
jgi:ribosome recycling factor